MSNSLKKDERITYSSSNPSPLSASCYSGLPNIGTAISSFLFKALYSICPNFAFPSSLAIPNKAAEVMAGGGREKVARLLKQLQLAA